MGELSTDDLSRLAARVNAFMDELSEPEREFLADVLASAGGDDDSSDVEGFSHRRSDALQIAINAQERAIDGLARVGKTGASSDRRRASLDNIQKFLDITRSMNPKI